MSQSFWFGYAAGQKVVNRLSRMTKQEASEKIPSVILSVVTFVLGFLLAEEMATFGWSMVPDMLEAWVVICALWFFTSLVLLMLRHKGTSVKRKIIFRYAGRSMGLYSIASIAVFSAIAAILGRIYNGNSSSILVWILPIFPITLPIWMSRRFHFVLGKGAWTIEEQYEAYQHKRMNLFLDHAKEDFDLDSFTPQIFEGYVCYDLAKEAASEATSMFYYDENIYKAFCRPSEDRTTYVINENRPTAIDQILRNALSEFTAENTGVAFWDNGPGIVPQFRRLVVGSQGLTQTRSLTANKFLASRKREIEELFQYRIQMYLKDYCGITAGLRGEALLAQALELHRDALWHKEGVRLEFDGGNVSVELDSIVITTSGIFACEVKNYGQDGQYQIVIEADGAWYREYPARKPGEAPHREAMKNPYAQNDRHVAYLEKFVNEILGRTQEDRVQVHNLIVLGNDQVGLVCDPRAEQSICRATTVYSQISRYHEKVLTSEEIQRLRRVLEDNCKPPKAYALMDFGEEMRELARSYRKLYRYAAELNQKLEACFARYPDPDLPQ